MYHLQNGISYLVLCWPSRLYPYIPSPTFSLLSPWQSHSFIVQAKIFTFFLLTSMFNFSENLVGSTFKIYAISDHFSHHFIYSGPVILIIIISHLVYCSILLIFSSLQTLSPIGYSQHCSWSDSFKNVSQITSLLFFKPSVDSSISFKSLQSPQGPTSSPAVFLPPTPPQLHKSSSPITWKSLSFLPPLPSGFYLKFSFVSIVFHSLPT